MRSFPSCHHNRRFFGTFDYRIRPILANLSRHIRQSRLPFLIFHDTMIQQLQLVEGCSGSSCKYHGQPLTSPDGNKRTGQVISRCRSGSWILGRHAIVDFILIAARYFNPLDHVRARISRLNLTSVASKIHSDWTLCTIFYKRPDGALI